MRRPIAAPPEPAPLTARRTRTPSPARRLASALAPRDQLGQPVFQRALDAGVERVEAIERERLGRAEAPPRRGVGPMVAEHAMQQRDASLRREARQARLEQLLAEHDVAEQPALLR